MRKTFRRAAFTCAAAVVGVVAMGSPAVAAANPYTPASACAEAEGGGNWTDVDDGHREIMGPGDAVLADVHLMRDSDTGKKCVATLKRADIWNPTFVQASLQVEGSMPRDQIHSHRYYAAVALDARGECVMYGGALVHDGQAYAVERERWDNCE